MLCRPSRNSLEGKHLHDAKLIPDQRTNLFSLELLEYRFTNEGYHVRQAPDGDEGLLLATGGCARPCHPRLDDRRHQRDRGLSPVAARQTDRAVPIIMLTARERGRPRARLDTGADDYRPSRSSPARTVARVAAASCGVFAPAVPAKASRSAISRSTRGAQGDPPRAHVAARADRIPPAQVLHGKSGACLVSAAAARRVWGTGRGNRVAHGRCPYRAPAQGDRDRRRDDPVRTVRSAGYSLEA